MGGPAAVLGVERSFIGRRWRARLEDDRAALAIVQRSGVSEIVGRVLAGRGVAPEDAERYLNPSLRELLPDPFVLRDMEAAADRLAAAIEAGDAVCVFGDYDVDGATSAALLQRFFRAVGANLRVYVPDRLAEGYGPNAPALERLAREGVRIVVTVDCGIAAHEALAAGKAAGLDIIVVDHHVAEARLPPARAVVNPNRLDDASGLGGLAAVGVTYMLVVALNRRLREARYYESRPEPDLLRWLDLVALGTVCDLVPLTGLNRAFVARGLDVAARRGNPGLTALSDVAGLKEPPGTYHLGFLLGPRVNAGGRVGEAGMGARLLATDDPVEAATLARALDGFNRERQEIEAAVLEAAVAHAGQGDQDAPVILVAGEGWHPGVIGIVASRLVGRYGRPACVVSLGNGVGKGSGRSVRGVDLGAAVIAARQAGLLVAGGGHPMAAGFTVKEGSIGAFREFLSERIGKEPGGGAGASLGLDGVLSVGAATRELLSVIQRAGPYGAGNAEPRFAFADAHIARADIVGMEHVRLVLGDASGGRLKAIAFRAFESDLGDALLGHAGRSLHLAGHLRADTWQGRNDVQLQVEDAAPAR